MALPAGTWWRALTPDQLAHVHQIEECWGAIAAGQPPTGDYRLSLRIDARGRTRAMLPPWHPYAYRAGWQWVSRLLVMEALGRVLTPDEHVHHVNHRRWDDRLANLELVSVWYHGRYHAYAVTLAGFRDDLGRFVEIDSPEGHYPVPRSGPVLGESARELQREWGERHQSRWEGASCAR